MQNISVIIIIALFSLSACNSKNAEKDKLIKESDAHFANKEYQLALNDFDRILQIDPKDDIIWMYRGKALHLLNRDDESFESLTTAVNIDPKNYEAFGYRAMLFGKKGDLTKALKDISVALSENVRDSFYLFVRIGIFLESNRFGKAIEDCNTILADHPSNASALYLRGLANKHLGKIDNALTDYTNAIIADPRKLDAYNNRALILTDQDKFDLAIYDYNNVIRLAGEKDTVILAFAYNNRGFTFHRTGNNMAALKDINYSIGLYPENSYAYKNRALVYIDMKQLDKACADLEKALQLGFTKKYGEEVLDIQKKNCW